MGNTGHVVTLANSIIGVSILAMPFCFKQCGIVLSVLLLLFSNIITRLCCHFLIKSAYLARRRNYEFLAFHTFGPTGKLVVELSIIGFLLGTCIAFFVVIGDLGPDILVKALNIDNVPSLRPSVLAVLAVCVVLPLGLLRNVDSLGFVCTASILFYLCLVIKVLSEAMPHLLAADWLEHVNLWRPAGVLQCIPIFSMALSCQTQVFEIYDALPDASPSRMNEVVRAAVNLCTGAYICVGFFGYIAFCTQNFTGNIMLSFSPSMVTDIMKLGFVLSLAVSFPLVIFPCRASLNSLLYRRVSSWHPEIASGPTHIPETRFKCITLFLVTVSLMVGLLLPNIELVLGLVGSTIGTIICLLLPALMFTRLAQKYSSERLVAQAIFFIAAAILILSTYANLYAADKAASGEMSSVVSFRPPELKKGVQFIDMQSINQPQIIMGKGVIGGFKEIPKGGAELIKEDLELKLKRKKSEFKNKIDTVRIEPPIPQEPKEPMKQAPRIDEPVKKIEVEEPIKEEQKAVVADVPESIKVEEKPPAPPLQVKVEQEAPKSVGEKPVQAEPPAAPVQEQAPGKRQEQVAQDAILKDDKEREGEEEVKHIDTAAEAKLLEKLAEHEQKQQQMLKEQQQIRKELEENKKESIIETKDVNVKPDTPEDQKANKNKAPEVEAQNSVKKVASIDGVVSNNSVESKADIPKEKKENVQEKKVPESQNIGELVNGLQKLTKELKDSLDEIKKQKEEVVKINKADIKPVGALLQAKKAESLKNKMNKENEVLSKRIKRETNDSEEEHSEKDIPLENMSPLLASDQLELQSVQDSLPSNHSSVQIKVPQTVSVSEVELKSDPLTSDAANAAFDVKPITRDLKTVDEDEIKSK